MEYGPIFKQIIDRHYEKHNSTNVSLDRILFWKPLETHPEISVIYIVIICITALVGLVGNVLVIGAVCVHRKLRTTGNVFIVNLAIADFFVVTVVHPYTIVGVVLGPEHFVYNETVCHIVSTVCVMSCANSMMTLAAIALNRYIFVCRNRYYSRVYNRCTTPLICIGMWTLVFLVDLPNYTGWGAHAYDYKSLGCSFSRNHNYGYVWFLSACIFWVPFILVLLCYLLIYKYVQKNRKELRKAFSRISCKNRSLLETRKEEDIRMVRTFFIVVIVFLMCWAPYDALIIIDYQDVAPIWVYVVLISIGHSNSSINCILYATTNRRFRRGYMEFISYLLCRCQDQKSQNFFLSTKKMRNLNSISNQSASASSLNTAVTYKASNPNIMIK